MRRAHLGVEGIKASGNRARVRGTRSRLLVPGLLAVGVLALAAGVAPGQDDPAELPGGEGQAQLRSERWRPEALSAYVPVLASITVTPGSANVAVGGTKAFSAAAKDQLGNPMSVSIAWGSSNTAVGTITSTGVFTGVASGGATVTARSGAVMGSACVAVGTAGSTFFCDKVLNSNGTRVFPTVMYYICDEWDETHETCVKSMSRVGTNYTIDYWPANSESWWTSVHQPAISSYPIRVGFTAAQKAPTSLSSDSHFLFYAGKDEPTYTCSPLPCTPGWTTQKDWYNARHSDDPAHPVFMNVSRASDQVRATDALAYGSDALMMSNYPNLYHYTAPPRGDNPAYPGYGDMFYSMQSNSINTIMQGHESSYFSKPIYQLCWSMGAYTEGYFLLTDQELRACEWTGITMNLQGAAFYSYKRIGSGADGVALYTNDQALQAANKIAGEIRGLNDVLVLPTRHYQHFEHRDTFVSFDKELTSIAYPTGHPSKNLNYIYKTNGSTHYFILVNVENRSMTDVTISISDLVGAGGYLATTLGQGSGSSRAGRTLDVTDGRFLEPTIDGFAVHIYKLTPKGSGSSGVLDVRVAASSDDAEMTSGNGNMYLTSSDLELIYDVNNGGDQDVGMRFNGVTIPNSATITNAYLQFTVNEVNSQATSLVIYGEAASNATTFTTTAWDIGNRTLTAASVSWPNVPAWTTVGAAGADQRTPNLASVIQEIVNRSGWASGNSLVLRVKGSSGSHRTATAWDGNAAQAPLLHVEYGTPSSGCPSSGLVGYWKLNELPGSGTAADSSVNGNNGTTVNGATFAAGKSGYGNALSLDGVNDFVEVADPASGVLDFGSTQDFTISAWIKTTATGKNVVEKRYTSTATSPGYVVSVNSGGRLAATVQDGTNKVIATDDAAQVNDGNWHHVAAVFDRNGSVYRYVDGGASGTNTAISAVGSVSNTKSLDLGRYYGGGTSTYFGGLIDEVRIYNRALTAAEISTLSSCTP